MLYFFFNFKEKAFLYIIYGIVYINNQPFFITFSNFQKRATILGNLSGSKEKIIVFLLSKL